MEGLLSMGPTPSSLSSKAIFVKIEGKEHIIIIEKLDQGTWLCLTLFDNFEVDF